MNTEYRNVSADQKHERILKEKLKKLFERKGNLLQLEPLNQQPNIKNENSQNINNSSGSKKNDFGSFNEKTIKLNSNTENIKFTKKISKRKYIMNKLSKKKNRNVANGKSDLRILPKTFNNKEVKYIFGPLRSGYLSPVNLENNQSSDNPPKTTNSQIKVKTNLVLNRMKKNVSETVKIKKKSTKKVKSAKSSKSDIKSRAKAKSKKIKKKSNSTKKLIVQPELSIPLENPEESDDSCPQLVPIVENPIEAFESSEESIPFSEYDDSDFSELDENNESINLKNSEEVNINIQPKIFKAETKDLCPLNIFKKETSQKELAENSFSQKILETIDLDEDNVIQNVLFNSRFYCSFDSKYVLLLLKEKLHIYGTVKFKVLSGAVDVFGYIPEHGETHEIYSPRGYSLINIYPLANTNNNNIQEVLANFKDKFLDSDLCEIQEKFDSCKDALLILQKNNLQKSIQFLIRHMRENLFPNLNTITSDTLNYGSEHILRSVFYQKSENEIIIDPDWNKIRMQRQTKLMIIGGKSVGKSTFLRYMVNKELNLHKKILLIDLDIGQSEVFLPQTISATIIEKPLLGPGYFFNLIPIKAILYGDKNVVIDPKKYLKDIKELSKYCHENDELQEIPWLINTMGYSKGFGLELIGILCNFFRPSTVVQIQSSKFATNFEYIINTETVKNISLNIFKNEDLIFETSKLRLNYLENIKFDSIVINSQTLLSNKNNKKDWHMTSKDYRYANIINRLGIVLKDDSDWLNEVKPISCSINDIKIKLCGSEVKHEEDVFDLINSNLVYLCRYEETNNFEECYGIGIVRSVDNENKRVYLICSIGKYLKYVNCLCICNIPLPNSIYLNQGTKVRGTIPYVYNTMEYVASKNVKSFDRSKNRKISPHIKII